MCYGKSGHSVALVPYEKKEHSEKEIFGFTSDNRYDSF